MLPKTLLGWRKLFWLTLRCCPIHHKPLMRDCWFGDPGTHLYGFCCDGVSIWPRGLFRTLAMNKPPTAPREGEAKPK